MTQKDIDQIPKNKQPEFLIKRMFWQIEHNIEKPTPKIKLLWNLFKRNKIYEQRTYGRIK